MSADLVAATVKEFLADREAGPALSECTSTNIANLFAVCSYLQLTDHLQCSRVVSGLQGPA